jgi:hypothetical protein
MPKPLTADQHADLARTLQRIQTDLEAAHATLVAAYGKKASRLAETSAECVAALLVDLDGRAAPATCARWPQRDESSTLGG